MNLTRKATGIKTLLIFVHFSCLRCLFVRAVVNIQITSFLVFSHLFIVFTEFDWEQFLRKTILIPLVWSMSCRLVLSLWLNICSDVGRTGLVIKRDFHFFSWVCPTHTYRQEKGKPINFLFPSLFNLNNFLWI